MYKRFFKIFLDFLAALILIVLTSPVMLICALLIKLKEPDSKVLFKQERAGYRNQSFNILKFRTMIEKRFDENGQKLSDAQRLTRLGNFMRKTSLDELPQLFNILLGQMSLIGPRPLFMSYIPYYTETELRRHEVRPGISGWAQVNGRNAISWGEKLAFDVWYVDHCSLWLDIKIMFMTVQKVFKREGISIEGFTSMPKFIGSDADYSKKSNDVKRGPQP